MSAKVIKIFKNGKKEKLPDAARPDDPVGRGCSMLDTGFWMMDAGFWIMRDLCGGFPL
jgi:hypothetical protein